MTSFIALLVVGVVTALAAAVEIASGPLGVPAPNLTPLSILITQGVLFVAVRFVLGRKVANALTRPSSASSEPAWWLGTGARLFAEKSPRWMPVFIAPLAAMLYLTFPALVEDDVAFLVWGFALIAVVAMTAAMVVPDHGWRINFTPTEPPAQATKP